MPAIRTIKNRIQSVTNTKKITKAMNLVATANLQKAKTKLQDTRPFYNESSRIIKNIINSSKNIKNIYINSREIKNSVFIIVTSNRGLCGGYNANVSKLALKNMENKNEHIISIGTKGKDFFNRRNKNVVKTFDSFSETSAYEDAVGIANVALELYKTKKVDEVFIVYTEFETIIKHNPKIKKILPLDKNSFKDNNIKKDQMTFEPNEEEFLDALIPEYIKIFIYGSIIESSACEQGSRMMSMDSATKNASDMIEDLTLLYNMVRQGKITQEINEIVSGANAIQ